MTHRGVGTRNLYALAPDALRDVQRWLVGLWDGALGAFAAFAAAADPPPDPVRGPRP